MRRGKKLVALGLVIIMIMVIFPVRSQAATKLRLKNVKSSKIIMYAGCTFRLKSNISTKKLKFTSSNKKVATVSCNGKITAKKRGNCKIKVTIRKNKEQSKTIRLTVKQQVRSIKPETSLVNLCIGESRQLNVNISPSNANNKKLKWLSSDESIASVTQLGVVTAYAAGRCDVRASATDGSGKEAVITIEVSENEKQPTENTQHVSDDTQQSSENASAAESEKKSENETEEDTEIGTNTETESETETDTETAMPKEKIMLYGDDSFKQEILKDSNETIVPDAIYVSVDGNDDNSGNRTAPFQTIQKALNTVKAGQTIYVREGTYTARNTFCASGKEGSYITLRNYPGETPYLTMSEGASGAILSLDGNDYIKIEGLEIGGFIAKQAYGILLDADENHIIIKNNEIHNLCTTEPGENEGGEANAILCLGEGDTEEKAISNICIEGNKIYGNTTGWCEAVSVAGNAEYVNIINNTVYNNTNIGIDFYGNAGYCSVKALDQPRYSVAAGNEIYSSVCSYAECAGLYVDGARDIVLENNKVHDNMYGIEIGAEELQEDYPVTNIIVRNNLVYDNSAGGIRVGGYDAQKTGYVKNTQIYNNTVINNGTGEGGYNGELCFVKCDGIDVKNNIVYKENTTYPMIGGDLPGSYVKNVTFANNIFYSPAGENNIYFEFAGESKRGMDAFNVQTGGTDIFGKPEFQENYSLKAGSCGIDMGNSSVIPYMGNLCDIANRDRVVNVIDVGAFEYQQ